MFHLPKNNPGNFHINFLSHKTSRDVDKLIPLYACINDAKEIENIGAELDRISCTIKLVPLFTFTLC